MKVLGCGRSVFRVRGRFKFLGNGNDNISQWHTQRKGKANPCVHHLKTFRTREPIHAAIFAVVFSASLWYGLRQLLPACFGPRQLCPPASDSFFCILISIPLTMANRGCSSAFETHSRLPLAL